MVTQPQDEFSDEDVYGGCSSGDGSFSGGSFVIIRTDKDIYTVPRGRGVSLSVPTMITKELPPEMSNDINLK